MGVTLLLSLIFLCFCLVKGTTKDENQLANERHEISDLSRIVRSPNAEKQTKRKKLNKRRKQKSSKEKSRRKDIKRKSTSNLKKTKKAKKQGKVGNRKFKKRSKGRKKTKKTRKQKSKPRKIKKQKKGGKRKSSKSSKGRKKIKKLKALGNIRRKAKKSMKKCARQTGPDDSTCLANIETAMDYEGNQIKNFKNQKRRIEHFDKLMKNKGGKKDNFKNSTSYLATALGTNKSCPGTKNTTDAQNAVALIDETKKLGCKAKSAFDGMKVLKDKCLDK